MKECLYAWYPPANDVWKTYRKQPDSYGRQPAAYLFNRRISATVDAELNWLQSTFEVAYVL